MAEAKEYNPLDHSIVQALLKADGCNQYEVPDYVEALLFGLRGELDRCYWNAKQAQLDDREDWQLLDVGEGFEYRRYFWGDCDCGFDERFSAAETEWGKHNKHAAGCYQTELSEAQESWDLEHRYKEIERSSGCDVFEVSDQIIGFGGKPQEWQTMPSLEAANEYIRSHGGGSLRSDRSAQAEINNETWRKLFGQRRKFEDDLYSRLCQKFNLPMAGCACHCTCEYEHKWREFCVAQGGHGDNCSPQLPNLKFGAVVINWYKHMGRGMSCNVNWNERQWREWFDDAMRVIRLYDTCHQDEHQKFRDEDAGLKPFETHERVQCKDCKYCVAFGANVLIWNREGSTDVKDAERNYDAD